MGSRAANATEKQALEQLASGTKEEDWRAAAVLLASGSGEQVDNKLLEMFHTACDRREEDRAELLSRILAERDPDRDPAYSKRLIPDRVRDMESPSRGLRFAEWLGGELGPTAVAWGFTRLRRMEPVRHYAEEIGKGSAAARAIAAYCLGDTVDAAAFDVLLNALPDRSKKVRYMAVMSVRRLAQSGLADAYAGHTVRGRLAELLTDSVHGVRVAAAQTLYLFGDEALVTDALSKTSWSQRKWKSALEEILRGEIPPLPEVWIGER